MKKRETRDISEQDVVEQRTSQTSCGPIRLVKVRTRWFVSAVDLGQALGLTEAHNPFNCFKCDLPEKSLKNLYCFPGDKKARSLLTLADVERILGKRNVLSSTRRERTPVLKTWVRQLRKELAQPMEQESTPVEQSTQVETELPEVSLTMERIAGNTVPATTSLKVAEYFEKEHRNVLRDIRETIAKCSKSFNRLNFEQADYTDSKGEVCPMYLLSRDGFMMLAMSYTSPRAMRIKESYIAAFNAMETRIHTQAGFDMPRTLPEALRAYADEVEAHTRTRLALVETEQRAARAEAERDFEMEARKLDAPKVMFAEAVETDKATFDMRSFCQSFRSASGQTVGRNTMFDLMVRHDWLDRVRTDDGTRYIPKGEAAQKCWFRLLPVTIRQDGRNMVYQQVYLTSSGVVAITSRLLRELESMGFYNSNLRNM